MRQSLTKFSLMMVSYRVFSESRVNWHQGISVCQATQMHQSWDYRKRKNADINPQLKFVLARLHSIFASGRHFLGNARKALIIERLYESNTSLRSFTVTSIDTRNFTSNKNPLKLLNSQALYIFNCSHRKYWYFLT